MKEFIDSHPERVPRDVNDLCKQIGFPYPVVKPGVFQELYRSWDQKLLHEYTACRCSRTMRVTNKPIKVVAAEAGYQKQPSLRETFKELFHLNPMEFRKLWRRREFQSDVRG